MAEATVRLTNARAKLIEQQSLHISISGVTGGVNLTVTPVSFMIGKVGF
jgi:hypothetical protein